MKGAVKNITTKTVSILMILVIGLLVINQSVFTHTHKLQDGTVVTHAHPFNKSNDTKPYKSHHHNNADLYFIQNLELLFALLIIAFLLIPLSRKLVLVSLQLKFIINFCCCIFKGRAPPPLLAV